MSDGDKTIASESEQFVDRPTPGPWYAMVDDEIGGWAIMNYRVSPGRMDPGRGHIHVGTVTRRTDAELICQMRGLFDLALQMQREETGT